MDSEMELLARSFFQDYLSGKKSINEIYKLTRIPLSRLNGIYSMMIDEMKMDYKKIKSAHPSRTEIINENLCVIYQSKMNYEN